MSERPLVGVAVCLRNGGKVLLGKRLGKHCAGTWGFPGGHLEFGESFEEAGLREVKEETGLDCGELKFWTINNHVYQNENKHYVTVLLTGEYVGGAVKVMEADKCEFWSWFSWHDLPEPLMPIIKKVRFNANLVTYK